MLSSLYRRYRSWEDAHLQLLDQLNAGQTPGPHWTGSRFRRLMVQRLAQASSSERQQMRDFLWRWRGWRSWAALAGLIAATSLAGLLVHLQWPGRFGALEAVLLLNVLVLGLALGLAGTWFTPQRFAPRRGRSLLLVLLMAVGGALVGASLAALHRGQSPWERLQQIGPTVMLAGLVAGGVYAAAVALIVSLRNRELAALNAQLRAEAEAQRLQRQASDAQLRLLQAQIEPHFLFNTLGAVQQLAEQGAPDAAALTARLIRFLRASMGAFRNDTSTLGAELDLAEAYLGVMQSRLGQRLVFAISVAQELREQPLPTTLLITLVENAIKHGIEPSPRGGSVTLRAWCEAGRLELEVADTGVGMAELPGSGAGLSNLREQLRLRHGGAARLELFDNEPCGLVARLSLPLETLA